MKQTHHHFCDFNLFCLRFISEFNHDESSKPRSWSEYDDIQAITKTARMRCLELLCVLTAIRLDEAETDRIRDTLVLAFIHQENTNIQFVTDTWENVPVEQTLITPIECKKIWDKFLKETDHAIVQANTSRDADRRSNYIKKIGVGVLSTVAVVTGGVAAAAGAVVAGAAAIACATSSVGAVVVAKSMDKDDGKDNQ